MKNFLLPYHIVKKAQSIILFHNLPMGVGHVMKKIIVDMIRAKAHEFFIQIFFKIRMLRHIPNRAFGVQ